MKRVQVEDFKDGYSMARYIVGAMLMNLAACWPAAAPWARAVLSGAIFALTAWLALAGMWAGGGLMELLRLAEPVHTTQPATQQAPLVVPVAP